MPTKNKAHKIKVKAIEDPKTKVAVNNGHEIIAHIKSQFASYTPDTETYEVSVFDFWSDDSSA